MLLVSRRALAAAMVSAGVCVAGPAAAHAAAPVIVNGPGDSLWSESHGLRDDAGSNGLREVGMTFVVRHDPSRRITGVAIDSDNNGTDNTNTAGVTAVTSQYLGTGGTSSGTQRLQSDVVRFNFDPGRPGDFDCGVFGATRKVSKTYRYAVVDDAGQRSSGVSQTLTWSENDGCTAYTDYAALEAVSPGNAVVNTTPNATVPFGFTCDDDDSSGGNDRCDYILQRWRRLNDGALSSEVNRDAEDNTARTFTLSFPQRGVYVVEAKLCGEDNCTDSPEWWRLGTVKVNEVTNPSATIGFSGGGVVNAASPPEVNAGATVTASATALIDSGGAIQAYEWDTNGDGTYDTLSAQTPLLSGSTTTFNAFGLPINQNVTLSQGGVTRDLLRVTDSGAIDVADDQRRVGTAGRIRVNAVPTANGQSVSTNEDTAKTITLSGADADGLPGSLTYDIATQPAHGSVSCAGASCTYTPDANYNGTDTFTFTTKDGPVANRAWATSTPATVTVNVAAVNDAPVANDQSVSVAQDTPLSIQLTGSDVENTPLTFTAGTPAHGSVSCNTAGACTYTPNAGYVGSDSFTFTASDGTAGDTGTVTIAVTKVNHPPAVSGPGTVTTPEDTPTSVTFTGGDPDGDAVTWSYSWAYGGGLTATVDCDDAGTCEVTPATDGHGTVTITATVSDGQYQASTVAEVVVTPVNDAPVGHDRSVSVDEDDAASFTVSADDVDSPSLTFSAAAPAHGTASCGADGACTYTPVADYNGSDSFDVTVSDGQASNTLTVSVTVDPVNDAPTAIDTQASTDEDTAVDVDLIGVDVDGDSLTYTITVQPQHGTVTCDGGTCTYAPDPDFHGTDTFRYTVTDAHGTVSAGEATVTVGVASVNDLPHAQDDSITTDEDTPTPFVLGATDADGDTLTYVAEQPQHGTVDCTASSCSYTPDADFHGADAFHFTVSDGNGGSDTATVTLTVRPVNDAPDADGASVTTAEDTAKALALHATDIDGDALTYAAQQPQHGTVACTDNDCTYTPAPNFNGTDGFTYSVDDGNGGSDTATISITVDPVNDAPTASDQTVGLDEDTTAGVTLSGADVDGDTLTYDVTQPPAHGSVACTDTACAYTPDADFNGTDAFTFTVSDGTESATGTVTLIVASVNDAPTAADRQATTDEDTPVGFTLSGADVDGDSITFEVADGPGHGQVTCTTAGDCTYTPDENYNGEDSFTYWATDAHGLRSLATATISVRINAVNDQPVASDQTASTDEDTAADLQLGAVDVDGDALTYAVKDEPAHGAVICSATGACSYVPADDYSGSDEFTFTASDGALTDEGRVSLLVRPVNDAPTLDAASLATDEDVPGTVTVSGQDVDGDLLTYALGAGPAHGTASCTSAGTCTYTGDGDFNGGDQFTVEVRDPDGATATAVVTVTVRAVNDAPAAEDAALAVDEDHDGTVSVTATDVDGDALTYTRGTDAAHGHATCTTSGTCTYTPDADFNGDDAFTFVASDGTATSTGTVRVTVRPVNDAPVADDRSASTEEDTPVSFTLHGSDVDGDTFTYEVVGQPSHGQVTCSAAGACTYTPDADYNGTDSFDYRVTDEHGVSSIATATVDVTISAVNDAPVALDQHVSGDEDHAVGVTLHGTDVDGDALSYGAGQPAHGHVTCAGADCTYTPDADFNGDDAFTFTVSDGSAQASATIDIHVTPVNDAPTANAQSVSTDEDTPVGIDLSGSDVDGDTLTYGQVDGVDHGGLSCAGAHCTYTPAADYHGGDELTFGVDDGHGGQATAKVSITVRPVNDAPVAPNVEATTPEDTPVVVLLAGTDVDGDTLTYEVTDPQVSCTGNSCTYTPAPDFDGEDTFGYTVRDGHGGQATGQVRVIVSNVVKQTVMTVPPVLRITGLPLKLTLQYQARLTRRSDGAPLAGRTVVFYAGSTPVGTAVTNSDGRAAYGLSVGGLLGALLQAGYKATFAGDANYASSTATGSVIG